MSQPNYKSLQKAISRDEKRSIVSRWAYGHALLHDPKKMSNTGKSLRHGALEALLADAVASSTTLTEREIQYRLQCARAYRSINEIRTAASGFESWTELREAGFPAVEGDDPDDLSDAVSTEAPDAWEQLSLIPGLGEVLKVRGRSIRLAEATVSDVVAYRDMYAGIHDNFAKRLALIENALRIMCAVEPDPEGNALDAWRRGLALPD